MSIILLSSGVLLCFFGLTGFAVVIYFGFKARKQTKMNANDNKEASLEQLIIVNYLALCLSFFGLIVIIMGMLLR